MAKKALGLDIDCAGIRAAEVVRRGRSRVVSNLAVQPLPAGTIFDGKVVDMLALVRGLEALLEKGEITADSAVLGLRSSWVTVKTHRLPSMTKRELDRAVQFEIPDLVYFPVEDLGEVCYDYFINSRSDSEVEIVVAACPREHLAPYIDALRGVNLNLEIVDLPSFSWPELLPGEKRRAFVEITEDQTTVQVLTEGLFKVWRVVPLGALHFRQGVQEAFGCTAEEAEGLCAQHDLDYLLLEGPGDKRVLRAAVQQLVGSVLQTLDFVRAQERAASFQSLLDELVLLGTLADLPGLGEMLGKEVGLPARTLGSLDLRLGFEIERPERLSGFGSALALGVRGISA